MWLGKLSKLSILNTNNMLNRSEIYLNSPGLSRTRFEMFQLGKRGMNGGIFQSTTRDLR